ncbi:MULTISPECIES: BREX-1 system adenine-specific DNA-methyltransferase PglX [unclassified Pseudomonas]|uniref:BREX-1 system adenine-specific DNA-methyltransferase PglX n=1 Tax=unclassified Pseudomonas TaxID=196821 RepID=UPI0031331C71
MSESPNNSHEQGMEKYFFRASAADFKKIPGSPVAYWLSDAVIGSFEKGHLISNACTTRKGMATGLNAVFVRSWHEVSLQSIGFSQSRAEAAKSCLRWFPYANGGEYRKWYGNFDDVVNWENDGHRLQTEQHESGRIRAVNLNLDFIFKPGLSWTSITSGAFSIRVLPKGFLFSSASNAMFCNGESTLYAGLLNSKAHVVLGKAINPTLNANPGDIGKIPLPNASVDVTKTIESITDLSRRDWDSYEVSWDFTGLALLHPDHRQPTLKASYQKLRAYWREMTLEMQRLEQENNRIFIDAYGLQDELDEEVDLSEITLTCNPHYRYGGEKSEEELEVMLLADTMRELVSYAVGCMFGRYSLDKPGLILANQAETLADYLAQVLQPTFPADDDNVIPLLDGDWFPDDITLRFRQFLRVAFGDAHYEDNLAFIEQALNVKGKRNYSLRDYFLGEFYADHVKRYKKRPIYWLFSSPKGAFSALVYLHRYRSDTVSVVLSYLRDFRKKLASRLDYLQQVAISTSASPSEKTKAIKEAEVVKKQLLELDDYERDTLYPLATEQVDLDLDKGVKENYLRLGAAMKKIVGLDAKGED